MPESGTSRAVRDRNGKPPDLLDLLLFREALSAAPRYTTSPEGIRTVPNRCAQRLPEHTARKTAAERASKFP
jgi:hypothetical protein